MQNSQIDFELEILTETDSNRNIPSIELLSEKGIEDLPMMGKDGCGY